MSPAARRKHRYLVQLREYSTYEVIVEAPDAATAEDSIGSFASP
jgi:hypothetical protein